MIQKIGFSLLALAFSCIAYGQKLEPNKTNLCKRWNLEKYEVFWIDYEPEAKEKNDYLLLKRDFTFESIDEGEYGVGTWDIKVNKEKQYLVLRNNEGEINMIIEELKKDKLVVVIDDEELIDLEIHFATASN